MNLQEVKQLIKDSPFQYYVYALKRPNGIPFYIGKGSNGRITDHEIEAITLSKVKQHNSYKINVINKIKRNNQKIIYDILLFTNNENLAFDKEIKLITQHKNILTNLTNGGEGTAGYKHSEEMNIKRSNMLKGKRLSNETKAKIGIANKGNTHSEKAKVKIGIASKGKNNPMFGKTHSKEAKARIGIFHKNKELSNETRAKISASLKGRTPANKNKKSSDETKAKISSSLRNKNNPMFGKKHTDKTKAKISRAQSKLTPEEQKQVVMALKNGIKTRDLAKQYNVNKHVIYYTKKMAKI